ncbi:MAG: IS66 family insertion sequence element accessory protein TnpB, partial [Sulfitobacter sp.]|nr:IS66 family insertion sequence element accessory protein TnpB [Sulfitobacter sp.]
CRQVLQSDPFAGHVFIFRNKKANAIKIIMYDGQGFWLCQKRLSQGRLTWWPTTPQARERLSARELQILLWHGNPKAVELAEDWRRVA